MWIQAKDEWSWFFDCCLPQYVKKKYSPSPHWSQKPFSEKDIPFFASGIAELSAYFTDQRSERFWDYLSHPKFRSSYLLYFLPLQAAKFLWLFQRHGSALEGMEWAAKKEGVFRVMDLGAGPGTGSLSLLLAWLGRKQGKFPVPIEFYWCDLQKKILDDGQALLFELIRHYPDAFSKITVHTVTQPWWKLKAFEWEKAHLVFMGHLLNETPQRAADLQAVWESISYPAPQGGVLFLEPASRLTSQRLSQLRDQLLELPGWSQKQIVGPCLHQGRCPLATGRDWCHWSPRAAVPSRWFEAFSHYLGFQRFQLKYSYLWLQSLPQEAQGLKIHSSPGEMRLVLTDALPTLSRGSSKSHSPPVKTTFLLCEPEKVRRWVANGPLKQPIRRGDHIVVSTQGTTHKKGLPVLRTSSGPKILKKNKRKK